MVKKHSPFGKHCASVNSKKKLEIKTKRRLDDYLVGVKNFSGLFSPHNAAISLAALEAVRDLIGFFFYRVQTVQ